jgi:translation initiation factor IF-1
MDLYVISLASGATGLAAMAVLGLSHAGHGGPGGHGGHDIGHGVGHVSHGGHDIAHGGGHAGHGAHGGHGAHAAHVGDHGASWMQSFLSPRVLFALLIGFGAGGLIAQPLGEPWRLGAAILGAAAFESLLVGPIWRFLFRFESRPAVTLESSIEDDARAVTGFDANGNGLVAVDVDGQIVQLLATLSADDRSRGVRIRSGDVVRVAEVDAARGRCIVRSIDH